MEKVVVQEACAEYHQSDRRAEQALDGDPLFEDDDGKLHEMKNERGDADDPAAGEHLDKEIVVHIGKKPVFDAVRPVGRDGFIKPDAEHGRAEKIFQAAFPDKEAVGIVESSVEDDGEKLRDLFPKHDGSDNDRRDADDIENADKFALRRSDHAQIHRHAYDGKAPHQDRGAALRKKYPAEEHKSQHV